MADTLNTIENYFLEQMKAANLYYSGSLTEKTIPPEILALVTKEQAMRYHILPIAICDDGKTLGIVTDTQQTFKQRQQLEHIIKRPIKLVLVSGENLRLALLDKYGIASLGGKVGTYQRHTVEEDMTPLKGRINTMLQAAAREGASDIHILPTSGGVLVHFRVHGHMYNMTAQHGFSVDEATNVTNLIKQMDESGNADISKTNMPNEGSFYLSHGAEIIFVRLETLPVGNEAKWQKIVLRLLPQASAGGQAKRLDDIGYTPEDLAVIKSTLYRNSTGMFINSGPTGAGKTTSLYAQIYYVLEALGEDLHVFTIDDPIEIREERFTQVQVRKASNETISLTDIKILIAALRADPDIILYNEIRDMEGAIVAMQASTTGHKLFSTVHAADCIRTISRLLDLNVSRTTLLSELKMIISQRLVAKICPYCSRPHMLTQEEKAILSDEEKAKAVSSQANLRERGGIEAVQSCQHCNHGIIGRTAIAEYVVFNTAIRDALLDQQSFSQIHDTLRKFGYKNMWEKGFEMALRGEIALSTLIHAVGKED